MPVISTIAGCSTLGIKVGYAIETTAGTKPTAFIWLPRCTSIGDIPLDQEDLDASAIEDRITRYVEGRQDTGGDWALTFNLTTETKTGLKTMLSASATGKASGLATWFTVWDPNDTTDAIFLTGRPGTKLPLGAISGNEVRTIDLNITIDEYKEFDTAIEPE